MIEPMLTSRTTNIAVLGDINADMTMIIPYYPGEGDDCTARSLRWGSGGSALNAAVTFAVLGGHPRLLGRVGRDPAAGVALRVADQRGIDISLIQEDEHLATGTCAAIISPGGQRTMFSFRGANVAFDATAVTPELLEHVHLLYLSAHALLEGAQRDAALCAVELAHAQGVPIVLDLSTPAIRRCPNDIFQLLPRLWLLCLNEDELRLLLPGQEHGTAITTLLRHGGRYLALKQGRQGCTLATGDQRLQAAPPVVTAIDTTASGDAFAAGCAWALLHHGSIHESALLGNMLGALTATRPGAADALPGRDELRHRLALSLQHLLHF